MIEFEEIALGGGKLTLTTFVDKPGSKSVQLSYTQSRGNPLELICFWALPPGIVVEELSMGGIGTPWPTPRLPGSIPILVASDIEGRFGHNCPSCDQYWRSGSHPNNCPYCGIFAASFQFLSKSQLRYVQVYCQKWEEAYFADAGSEHVIDLDEIAEATLRGIEKPDFYISEQRQQTLLRCASCGEFNDILGRFGHCSNCYTRNDFAVLRDEIVPSIRNDLNAGHPPARCLQHAVSSFETILKNYFRRLGEEVHLIPERLDRLTKKNFRNWDAINAMLAENFGFKVKEVFDETEWQKCQQLFQRRHVYEHNGGIVDQEYIDLTGDTSVRVGQLISETPHDVHMLLSAITKFVKVVHAGFHVLLPVKTDVIEAYQSRR